MPTMPFYIRLHRHQAAPLVLAHKPYLTANAAIEDGRRYARLQASCDGADVDLWVVDTSDEPVLHESFPPNRRFLSPAPSSMTKTAA